MHVLREILRQKLALGLTNRRVASAVGVSAGKVHSVYSDARSLGIDAAAVEAMTDAELTARLYPKTSPACVRQGPDCAQLHLELRRRAVTLALLHVEYLAEQPQGLRYSAFCERYREWLKRHSPVMRQVHLAGDKLFVDYAGMKPRLLDPLTGEFIEVELFVAVLGASNYTYAEATRTQQVTDFTSSVARALTFIGGVPCAIVPDQLKSAIVKACRYDPGVQRTTAELGRYYNTTILPARPMSPRDKAKVEVGVQVAERWLLARIRNETFTSLGDLNRRLFELTEIINTRPMRAYKATASSLEIFHLGARVACHVRSYVRGGRTTTPEHMPSTHRAHAEWTPSRILGWAETVGQNTRALCDVILRERRHPEWGYRSCLGLFRLAKKYGDARVEAASARALFAGARSYRHVLTILQHNLDQQPLPKPEQPATAGASHENVRGRDYYH